MNFYSDQSETIISEFLKKNPKNYIDGKWCDAVSGKTFEVTNPANGSFLANVPEGAEADIDLAVAAARRAYDNGVWSKLNSSERERILMRLADLVEQNIEVLSALDSKDVGMPYMAARMGMIPHAIASMRYTAGWTSKLNGETREVILPGEWHTYTLRESLGVAGLITPWNVPLPIALNKIVPALAAGCTAVLKPAEQTPLSALYLAKLVEEAGIPAGVVNIVCGYGTTAGARLVAHPDVNKISFTGSTAVGKNIISSAAQTMKRVSMELGGKSPLFIFDDADLEMAIDGAAAAIFSNSGQVCAAGSRLFAHKSIFEKVIAGVTERARALKIGNGMDLSTQIGPIVSEKQRQRVMSYIEAGRQAGAEIVTGGNIIDGPGYFVEPTVFVNTSRDMKIVREEIFGPVLSATVFDDDDLDALATSGNDTEYGLASYIFTKDLYRAHGLARRLKAGNVIVNATFALDPAMPFGGYKQSGFGRENGREGVESYTEIKSIAMKIR